MMTRISFDGGGWTFPFMFGVGVYIQDTFECMNDTFVFCGVSVGSCVATSLASGSPIRPMYEEAVNKYETPVRTNPFLMVDTMDECVQKHLSRDEDILKDVSKRLRIGVSHSEYVWQDMVPRYFSSFRDRRHITRCIRASCNLPVVGSIRGYTVDDTPYFDGGLTDEFIDLRDDPDTNICTSEEIRVSPWSNTVSSNWIGSDIGIPHKWAYLPHSKEALIALYELGYMKAKDFFSKNPQWDAHRRKEPLHEPTGIQFNRTEAELRTLLLDCGCFESACRLNPIQPLPLVKNIYYNWLHGEDMILLYTIGFVFVIIAHYIFQYRRAR